MKTINKAFTFVELIVSVGIILLVSTIGYISYTGNLETKDNAKMIADLATIDNSFKSYFAELKTLPEASGNKSFYKADGSYAHDETDSAYGLSSFVSEKTFASKYLNSVPLDPRTGYYYAYGKTIDNKYYEIAGVEKQDNNYKSVVVGNYKTTGDELINLVREYNGPEFVGDNSSSHFPYNPEEKVLTASIYDYTGSVTVTRGTQNFTGNSILDISLVAGDKIVATANSTASIYFSDGSKSHLGDVNSTSELNLSEMSYKENSNLFTKVKLVLNIGTLWTSASKMSENSDFEVYSNNTVAAVRGTVFGVTVDASQNTNVVVVRGAVDVEKINPTGSNTSLINIPGITDGSGTIIVNQNEAPKGLQVSNTRTPTSSTGAINEIPGTELDKESILIGGTDGNEEIVNLEISELTNDDTSYNTFSAKVSVSDKVLKKFDYFKLNNTNTKTFTSLGISEETEFTLTGGTSFDKILSPQVSGTNQTEQLKAILTNSSGQFELLACKLTKKGEKCSKSRKFTVSEKMSYIEDDDNTAQIVTASPYPTTISLTVQFGNETVANTLATSSYSLVGYAGYNSLKNIDFLSNSNNNLLSDKGRYVITGANGKYSDGNSCTNGLYGGNCAKNSSDFGAYSYDKNDSFATYSDGTKGIYLNTNPGGDFLKYDISSLGLNTASGFAIEMSVRGAALKRSTNIYYLMQNGLLKLALDNGKLYFGNNNGTTASITNSNLLQLVDNEFYKVTVISSSTGTNLLIKDNSGTTKASASSTTSSLLSSNDLYIGSYYINTTYIGQWNDIIDYVKIYRK